MEATGEPTVAANMADESTVVTSDRGTTFKAGVSTTSIGSTEGISSGGVGPTQAKMWLDRHRSDKNLLTKIKHKILREGVGEDMRSLEQLSG